MSAERRTWVSLSLFNILISNLGVNSVFMKFTKILNWEEVAIPVQEEKKSTERFGKTREKGQNRRIMFGKRQVHLGVEDSLNNNKSNSVSQRTINMVPYITLCRSKQTVSCLFGGRKLALSGGDDSAPSGEHHKSNRTRRQKGLIQSDQREQVSLVKWNAESLGLSEGAELHLQRGMICCGSRGYKESCNKTTKSGIQAACHRKGCDIDTY